MAKAEEAVRVMFVVDTTGSMGQYCTSLSDTLPQVFTVLKVLFAGRAQVDVIAYEDYCDGERLCRFCYGGEAEATAFAQTLRAGGGGDYPEASKTALHEAVRRMGDGGGSGTAAPPPLILFYTDAPPHTAQTGGANHAAEMKALAGAPPGFDWLDICRRVRAEGAQVHTFVPPQAQETVVRHHALLGNVVELPDTQPATITAATMGVVLQAMGQEFGERAAFEGRVVARVAGSLDGLSEEADGGHLWAARAPPAVKELVTMGFSQGMAATALRLARGAVDQAVELLLGGGVPEQAGGDGAAGELVPLRRGGLHVDALQGWARDLSGLPPRFAASEGFRETVFGALRMLIDPARPQRVLALTYNRVLGLLWRLACRRREDPRMEGLGEALGRCVLALEGEQQARLRAWVDESYDRSEEAAAMIRTAGAAGGALVLDAAAAGVELPSKEDMRSLVHAPTPAVLAAVQRLLTTVVRVDDAAEDALPEQDGVPQWVPCTLGGADLFGLLPHLALPGLMVTLRPACVIAILAYLSGNAHLAERAEALLTQAKGRWIPAVAKVEEYPEVLSAGFVRLVARVPQFLTEEEVGVYVRAARVLDARAASALRVEVVCGFRPRKGALFADEKARCSSCGVRRSLSLLQDGKCGLCLNPTVGVAAARGLLEPAEDKSHLVECRRCASLYAVVRMAALNVEPKCHYCRRGDASPPTVQCVRCANRYVRPGAAGGATFTCGECSGSAATQREEAEVAALEAANPGALLGPLGFAAGAAGALWSSMSLFKLWARHPELFVEEQPAEGAAAAAASLSWRGRKVLNADEAVASAVDRVARGDLSGVCNLCFEDCPVVALESACGRCDNVACAKCLKKWYASLQPGRLYTPTLALCPFCKRRPLGATLKKYNAAACGIVTSRKHGVAEATLRADMLYGWCVRCYRVREALPKVCGARVEGTPLEGFCCEGCAEAGDPEARQCPRCVAPTYKVDGCNHMSCPCGCEWCWECSEDCTDSVMDVYDHMMQEHGGIM